MPLLTGPKLFVATAAILVGLQPLQAANLSFVGVYDTPATQQFFDFTLSAPSNVTFVSWSYAGGINAAGQVIPRGGFDPAFTLFVVPAGFIGIDNDSSNVVDPVTGHSLDFLLDAALPTGSYRLLLQVYNQNFDGRTGNYAFDINGVDAPPAIPEPAGWAMLIAGFGLTGAAMRRRRQIAVAA